MKHAIMTAPPSANTLYVQSGNRRVKSRTYKQWRDDAVRLIVLARLPRYTRPKGGSAITICAAIDHRRDLDNLAKPIIDALVVAGIISDDRYVQRITLSRIAPGGPGGVEAGEVSVGVEHYGETT